MSDAQHNPTRRQEEQRGRYLAMIRETRQKFMSDFPEGCRVEFHPDPSIPRDQVFRTGKATILKIVVLREGMTTLVRYKLDDFPQARGFSECQIQTFLRDNPVRIEDPP
jgi:hypothetical protein